jgi:tight adherence protein B
MAGILFPALVALSVGVLVWSLFRIAFDMTDGDKRRLKNRLSTAAKDSTGGSTAQRSIRNDLEAEGLEGRLLRIKTFADINALLQMSFPEVGFLKFIGVCFAAFFVVFMLFLAFTMKFIVAFVAAALAATAPILYLVKRKNKRQRMLDDQLPEGMDFLGRALKAGHSLASGLQMMGKELPQPIAGEFMHAYDQHSLGIPMEQVLKDMTKRIDSTDFAFFVTAVLIQRQTGGDLSEVLKNISGMIRQRIRLAQQLKAKTAEGRFTGYLLTAFPAIIFVILYVINREYTSKLTDTTTGLKVLGAAFAMQIMGLYMIRKITTVKI